ncbi:hypothetical protein HO133_010402 [Letharia lupina]|uniref:Non-haem dioxygenase N-terminal domain-containing protein n=1 Tax=Letharia lupina TaxID=560253 RepID=A0A8H6CKV1_9LECA|nr:uncharacterized protein HO133_010402 [Letharia lupina]KAF6225205.1 hypothetical protein HO133_010402 [Letharia lupina]
MPTTESFAKSLPFPDDLPTVTHQRLELSKLLSGDEADSETLFEACASLGFFLLDLRGCTEGETILKETEAGFNIGQDFYALSGAEKSKFPLLPSKLGYKPIGGTKIEDGRPDRCEIDSLPTDDLLAFVPPNSNPPALREEPGLS